MVAGLVVGCRPAPIEAPRPPPALHQTAPAEVAQLCAEPARAWLVASEVVAEGSVGSDVVAPAVSRGACLGPVDHPRAGRLWHFIAQLQDPGAPRSRWELHTWIDDDGQPRFAELRTPEVVTRFRWAEGALTVDRLGDRLVVEDAGQLWVTPAHGLYVRELMLRLGVGRTEAGLVQRGFVPERDVISTLELELERVEGDRARANAGSTQVQLEGGAAGLAGLRITSVETDGAAVYLPSDASELAPFLAAAPTPEYRLPAGLEQVEVEIPGLLGAPKLGAELVYLSSGSASGAGDAPAVRRPAVLFVGGAGAQDRHGLVPGTSVDLGSHELQDALALAGFAVLRVDDRGVGASEIGDDPTPGFRVLVDDARRAFAVLAARPEVDPKHILVIGHGEGALVASILAGEGVRVGARKRRPVGLVVLASPGRNLRELVYDEIRAAMAGRRDGEIRVAVDRARRVHDAALAGDELPASSEGAREWMVEAFAEDPLARLVAVRAPILALQGSKDFQVSVERDFGPIAAAIATRKDSSAAELFDALDHLFKPEPQVSTPGHYADLRRHLEPAVIQRVVSWALEVSGS